MSGRISQWGAFIISMACAGASFAQEVPPSEDADTPPTLPEPGAPAAMWTTELGLTAIAKTGNTETNDFGFAGKVERETQRNRQFAELSFDYGDSNGRETKNRFFSGYQLDVTVSDRWYAFGNSTYTDDAFDGFDYRVTANFGAAVDIIDNDAILWTLRAGPGGRFETVEETGEDMTEFAMLFASRYQHSLNDSVDFEVKTRANWGESSTTVFSRVSLTASLNSMLSARFGYDVQYESDPPADAVETDTTARASLVLKRKPS